MNRIYVGFCKPKNTFFPIFSYLIRWVQGTEYSHCYIRWYSRSLDEDMYYHAKGVSVNFMASEVFLDKNRDVEVFPIEVTDDQKRDIVKWCVNNAGKSYDLLGVFGVGYVLFMKKFGKKVVNPFRNGKASMYCLEQVAYLMKDALQLDISDIESMDLLDLRNVVKEYNAKPVDKNIYE